MDTVLKKALEKRDLVASEINAKMQEVEDLRRELARADAFIRDWYEFSGETPPDALPRPSEPVIRRESQPRTRVNDNPSKEIVAKVARDIIATAGEPVARAALFTALHDRGIHIKGADPQKTFSTMLWRMMDKADLVHLRGFGYWLREWPYSPAKYDPEPTFDSAGMIG